jgi:hypothetical protein
MKIYFLALSLLLALSEVSFAASKEIVINEDYLSQEWAKDIKSWIGPTLIDSSNDQTKLGDNGRMGTASSQTEGAQKVITVEPTVFNSEISEGKTPYYFYYLVNVAGEPMMDIVARYELSLLVLACLSDKPVNWVAFINTRFVKEKKYLTCTRKKIPNRNVLSIHEISPEFSDSLDSLRESILNGSAQDQGLIGFELRFPFADHILSHHPVLEQAIRQVTTRHFPFRYYTPYFHIKSHSQPRFTMTAPNDRQLAEKKAQQAFVAAQVNEKMASCKDEDFNLESFFGFDGLGDGSFEKAVSELIDPCFLSSVKSGINVTSRESTDPVSPPNLRLGSSTPASSWGEFGSSNRQILKVFNNIFADLEEWPSSFLIVEACRTMFSEVDFLKALEGMKFHKGVYSAEGEMNHHNLNIFSFLSNDNTQLVWNKWLEVELKKMPNYLSHEEFP